MTDTAAPLDLARGFEPADYDMWRQLVEKALKGGDFDKRLASQTADGLRIKPLYTRADALAPAQNAVPGARPFTRGTSAQACDHGWQIHQRVIEPDPAAANAVILDELEGGANGVVLQIAGPGQFGVRISGPSDIAAALAGVHLDYAPVQLAGGIEGLNAARHFLGALASLKPKPGAAVSRLNVDPIGTLARFGMSWAPFATALAETVAVAGDVRASPLRLSSILVDATIPHEAGASEAQELSLSRRRARRLPVRLRSSRHRAGRGVRRHCLRSVGRHRSVPHRRQVARGTHSDRAHCRSRQGVAASDAHYRRHVGAHDGQTRSVDQHAAHHGGVRGRSLRRRRCDHGSAVQLGARRARPFCAPCRAQHAARACRRSPRSGASSIPSAARGTWRSLDDALAGKAWTLFQEIEAKGGIAAALASGALQDDIARVAEARMQALACGRLELTGISYFPHLGADGVNVAPHPAVPPLKGKPQVRALAPHRLAEPFEALRDAADAHLAKTGTRPRIFLANLGPIVEHNTRSTWAWNFLAGGGIEGLTSDGYADGAAAGAAFKASGAQIACLCSSDGIYAQEGKAAAKALKAAGARRVLMAGRPGEAEAGLREAGVDGFLFNGQDALATLQELQKALGVG